MAIPPPSTGHLRDALVRHDLWTAGQTATRRWAIGCVSLEVTQRCNLDCTLCYLSEHAEATRDPPLAELLHRVDEIATTYGPLTDVQISGGDPTLRSKADLIAVVQRIRMHGMRSSLLTNGILARRELLAALAQAGLTDVVFHVDLTQRRKGYASETALNALRAEYIDRARGLGLPVFFNTTVFDGNLHEVPDLVRFFVRHADLVRFASFQLGADTGRGIVRERGTGATAAALIDAIQRGTGVALSFDTLLAGHPSCNRTAMAVVAGGRCVDLLSDRALATEVLQRTAGLVADRSRPIATGFAFALAALREPDLAFRSLRWALRAVWQLRGGLLPGRGPAGKLTFLVHSFMDAADLDPARLDTCVFMAATPQGLMPMCQFNARRDEILLAPRSLPDGTPWDPAARRGVSSTTAAERVYPIKFLKGRARARALVARSGQVRVMAE